MPATPERDEDELKDRTEEILADIEEAIDQATTHGPASGDDDPDQ
jgi:hypothetical protein